MEVSASFSPRMKRVNQCTSFRPRMKRVSGGECIVQSLDEASERAYLVQF